MTFIPNTYNDTGDGIRIASLNIASANITDEGFYRCKLNNLLGSVNSKAIWINIQCKYDFYKFLKLM